jgi:serine phosphatase RsbU (regulator of sigma subunit)
MLRTARRMRPAGLAELVSSHAARIGLLDAGLWLVDVQQRMLVPYGKTGDPGDEGLSVDATLAGRAYRDGAIQRTETSQDPPAVMVWVPLFDGSDRIGVLGGRHEGWSEEQTDERIEDLTLFGTAVAVLLASHEAYTDVIVRTKRLRAPTLPAEMQWALLPPLTFSSDRASVCGVLEPAYDIGGDSFDYAVNDNVAHLGVFDAMGHGLGATLMASVAVGAYRHARRAGRDLENCYAAVDQAIANQFGSDRFVTGVLAELNVDSGEVTYVVAGHHPGLVLRQGRIVRYLDSTGHLPFGLGQGLGPKPPELSGASTLGHESLEPGDRVLLYTDGVIEGRDPSGQFFGVDRLEELFVRADASDMPTPETLRRLIRAVLEHQADQLQDDATLLLVEWHGS